MSNSITLGWIDNIGVFFKVPSSTDKKIVYDVHYYFNDDKYDWICTCAGNWFGHKCKHIQACESLLNEVLE